MCTFDTFHFRGHSKTFVLATHTYTAHRCTDEDITSIIIFIVIIKEKISGELSQNLREVSTYYLITLAWNLQNAPLASL